MRIKSLVVKLTCVLKEEDFRKEEMRLKENYNGPVVLLKHFEEFVSEKEDRELEAYRAAFNSINNIAQSIERKKYKEIWNDEYLTNSCEWKSLKDTLENLHEDIKSDLI